MSIDTTTVRKDWDKIRQKPQEVERFAYKHMLALCDRIDELERLLAERELQGVSGVKTIIAGTRGRKFNNAHLLAALAASGWADQITEVVSGRERTGVDALGEAWAKQHGIPIAPYPADWTTFGKSAGPRRNRAMAAYADALIAVWDGASRGTKNMIDEANAMGLKVFVWMPKTGGTRKVVKTVAPP